MNKHVQVLKPLCIPKSNEIQNISFLAEQLVLSFNKLLKNFRVSHLQHFHSCSLTNVSSIIRSNIRFKVFPLASNS